MCKILDKGQSNLSKLIKLLPNIKDYETMEEQKLNEILPNLRKESGNCPVCIFAAIRQAGIPVYLMKDFDFKKECEEVFKEKMELEKEEEERQAMYG